MGLTSELLTGLNWTEAQWQNWLKWTVSWSPDRHPMLITGLIGSSISGASFASQITLDLISTGIWRTLAEPWRRQSCSFSMICGVSRHPSMTRASTTRFAW